MSGIIRHDVTGEKYLHWLMSSVTRCCNKNSRYVSKSCPKSSNSSFYLKVKCFKMPQKVTKYLGYFGMKICRRELLKIDQFGSTVFETK